MKRVKKQLGGAGGLGMVRAQSALKKQKAKAAAEAKTQGKRTANTTSGYPNVGRPLQSDMIEPDKELKFGGVKKYQTGSYPTYNKSSDEAKSFRDAFAAARKAGKMTFEWEGRSYGTRRADETKDQHAANMQKVSRPAPAPAPRPAPRTVEAPKETRSPNLVDRKTSGMTATPPGGKEVKGVGPGSSYSLTNKRPSGPAAPKTSKAPAAPEKVSKPAANKMSKGEVKATPKETRQAKRSSNQAGRQANRQGRRDNRATNRANRLNKRAAKLQGSTSSAKAASAAAAKQKENKAMEGLERSINRPMKTGGLKSVKPGQKGLAKLPKGVRNKMGYKKSGGKY